MSQLRPPGPPGPPGPPQGPPPGMPPGPPYGQPAWGPRPMRPDEERTWGAAAHWSAFVGAFVALAFVGPLLVLLLKGNESPYVRRQAVESLNFQLSMLIYAIVSKLTGHADTGWASLMVTVTFLGGVQLISVGVLGQYLARMFEESKNRPLYVISETVNLDRKD